MITRRCGICRRWNAVETADEYTSPCGYCGRRQLAVQDDTILELRRSNAALRGTVARLTKGKR